MWIVKLALDRPYTFIVMAHLIPAEAQEFTPPFGLLVIARLRGRPVGCGGLKFHQERPAELKRIWIASFVRGLGAARRLLDELERHGRQAGVSALRLETNRALSEPILYRRSGYVEVDAFNAEPYAHHWFEKRLIQSSAKRLGKTAAKR